MKQKLLLITLVFLCVTVLAVEQSKRTSYGNVIVSKVISVYDGDTFRCNINDFPAIIGQDISIRIYGVDTPEMKDKDPMKKAQAIKARDYVRSRLNKAKKIELRNIQRDKYFRILADVYADNSSISDELIKKGYAKPYFGGTKE